MLSCEHTQLPQTWFWSDHSSDPILCPHLHGQLDVSCSSHHRAKKTGPLVESPLRLFEQLSPRLHSLTTKMSTHMYKQKTNNQATLYSEVHQVKATCPRNLGSVIHNTLTVYESGKQVLRGLRVQKIMNPTAEMFTLHLIEKNHIVPTFWGLSI